MISTKQMIRAAVFGFLLCVSGIQVSVGAAQAVPAQASPGVLSREEAARILPTNVFYAGQSATLQGRNASGLRTAGGKLVLAALVDTSGYSSGIAERYQAYLITEVPLHIGDKSLPAGAYGFGFIAGDRVVVMDVGANELLSTATRKDDALQRPTPLQIVASDGQYRLYLGRSFVTFAPEERR